MPELLHVHPDPGSAWVELTEQLGQLRGADGSAGRVRELTLSVPGQSDG
ncbi:MAG: hypothetical protein AAGG07_11375 [Planctomycetota bacterium]